MRHIRLAIQGAAILVLLWSISRMVHTPLLWPFAAVLAVEALWLGVSLAKAPRRVDTGFTGVVASSVIAVYPVLVALLVPGPYTEPVWRFAVSYTVQLAALVLELWALLSLQDAFTQLPEARHVVQTGPYGYVRHPLYVAYTLAFFGSCLGVMRVRMWLLFALFVVLQWLRARAEERVLSATLPEYRDYRMRTGMFIPRWTATKEAMRRGDESLV
jgi:protein-S-isoprenylcysteine O-methyltransferase Ste14